MRPSVVAAFLLMGIVTYLPRCLPLVGLSRVRLPRLVEDALRYVGIAVMAALVAPDLAATWGQPPWGLGPRLAAAVPAAVVALWTRNMAWTVVVGVAAYALLSRGVPAG
ncbi:AzlD domain-containing protein [Thermaerobacter subterraneus]|uniref:Membrane protein n=1 Tax=Thermaerobacter subterraneus DSM 13965 TaxID=867903 RepID=K6PS08_9FIRM|nr:AzlD domain-containing protein [Thermaerobacter subterraneus]EKP95742.1 putative membrane protein [Thermaerobacter subterraneus DSM 13965]